MIVIYFVASILLIGSTQSLRRDSSVVYYGEELPQSRQSKSVLSDIANEIVRRSGSSQILNLNLSNLVLLLVLKAIVYSAGFIGNHTSKGRHESAEENYLSEGETALALGYLIGETCLYRAACEVPNTAKEYLGAADIVFQAMKILPLSMSNDDSYAMKMKEFQKAIDYGLEGQCPVHYNCEKEKIDRFLRPQ